MKPAVPNDLIRDARLRLASPSTPGAAMSRRELAEALNTYIAQHDPSATRLDSRNVQKFERGITRWPRLLIREALCSILGADTDEALGLHRGGRVHMVPLADTAFMVQRHTVRLDMLSLTSELVLVTDRRRVR